MDHLLYDELPVGVLTLDEALELRDASPRLLEDFGCTLDELLGVEIGELVAARDRRACAQLDRKLSRPSTQRLDLVALLELGERQRLARLLLRRRAQGGWFGLVECLDGDDNLVHELYAQHRRWSRALKDSVQGFAFLDHEGRMTDHNARFIELMGFRSSHGVLMAEEALARHPLDEFLADEPRYAGLRRQLASMFGADPSVCQIQLHERWLELEVHPIYLPHQGLIGHGISVRDRSDQRTAELERAKRAREQLRQRAELIEAQREAIRSLSAPRIPLTPSLSVVPLIGELDVQRVDELRERLLEDLSRSRTRTLILDLTGVPELDDASIAALVATVRALALIGVRTPLTGVNPGVARTLARTGEDSEQLEFHRNVRAALAASSS